MDSPSRSNGPRPKPAEDGQARIPGRSRVAARVERVLNTALAGERSAVLNLTAAEVLADALPVARVFQTALGRPGVGVIGHWNAHEMLRRSNLYEELLNSLQSSNPLTRAAAARICGAARLADAVTWLGDLTRDDNSRVRDAAVRSLALLGGTRAVELMVASEASIPLYRLAIGLSRAASDIDIEALMRRPVSEHAAVATVMACGLRRDALRVSPLLGIAHDRRWPLKVRLAACKALAMIGERSAADGLARLSQADPNQDIKQAADRAHRRLVRRAVGRKP